MPRHAWEDWEMIETLRIAAQPRGQWQVEITELTRSIQKRTDPRMDEGRVRVAVEVAANLIAGSVRGSSARLRQLYEQQEKKLRENPPSSVTAVPRRPAMPDRQVLEWSPTREDLERLLAFEGYGVDSPDLVFVGLEEYCDPDPKSQRENIRRRCTSSAYHGVRVDKNEAIDALEGLVKKRVPVWDMMAKIIASLTARSWEAERSALGSRPAHHRPSTLITELRALPRPGTGAQWSGSYLADWFSPVFSSRADFERKSAEISGRRIFKMLEQKDGPLIVFFYGRDCREWAVKHLNPLLAAPFHGAPCSFARTKNGTLLVTTGFYNGQHAATSFRESDIPALAAEIRALIGDRVREVASRSSRVR